jgi:hypothetical protein
VESKSPEIGSSEIAREILGYLTDHPLAQDTVEGIIEWWLLERRIKCETVKVKNALVGLIALGLVVEFQCRDGRARYASSGIE